MRGRREWLTILLDAARVVCSRILRLKKLVMEAREKKFRDSLSSSRKKSFAEDRCTGLRSRARMKRQLCSNI